MNYKILSATSAEKLQVEVEKHLNKGWRLSGDLKIYIAEQYNHVVLGMIEKTTYNYNYSQAMWNDEVNDEFIGLPPELYAQFAKD